MAQELIYTSAPSGVQPGSSGFCTVAQTAGMSPRLTLFLEHLSGYRPLFPVDGPQGDLNPVSYRFTSFNRGGEYAILSRVAVAGFDYTGRSNKIAHHIVLEPRELPGCGPAALLKRFEQEGVFKHAWAGDPEAGRMPLRIPEIEDELVAPAQAWREATGDAGWAGVLAESAKSDNENVAHVVFSPTKAENLLELVVESMRLLPRELRWQVSFSTYFTRLTAGASCRWRFCPAGADALRDARRHSGACTIDLEDAGPLERSSPLIEAARTGILPFADPVPKDTPRPSETVRPENRINTDRLDHAFRKPELRLDQEAMNDNRELARNRKRACAESAKAGLHLPEAQGPARPNVSARIGIASAALLACVFFVFLATKTTREPGSPAASTMSNGSESQSAATGNDSATEKALEASALKSSLWIYWLDFLANPERPTLRIKESLPSGKLDIDDGVRQALSKAMGEYVKDHYVDMEVSKNEWEKAELPVVTSEATGGEIFFNSAFKLETATAGGLSGRRIERCLPEWRLRLTPQGFELDYSAAASDWRLAPGTVERIIQDAEYLTIAGSRFPLIPDAQSFAECFGDSMELPIQEGWGEELTVADLPSDAVDVDEAFHFCLLVPGGREMAKLRFLLAAPEISSFVMIDNVEFRVENSGKRREFRFGFLLPGEVLEIETYTRRKKALSGDTDSKLTEVEDSILGMIEARRAFVRQLHSRGEMSLRFKIEDREFSIRMIAPADAK